MLPNVSITDLLQIHLQKRWLQEKIGECKLACGKKKYITFEYVENEMTIITAIEEADYIYM